MKPLLLTVQAFGPFSQLQQVDFTQLGNAPLFLINGATGAGKSTLLDAICFALYGQTSGKERDAAQMRCDHSPAELLTEVTFTFKLGQATYKVERQPQQERPKARGEGTTTQQTEANLWKLNSDQQELIVSKSAVQVNQHIEQLMGLDANQFRQVMVLPQGQFREFLLANSLQREALFETLFQTSIYTKLQNALQEKAKQLEDARNNYKQQEALILKDQTAVDLPTLLALKEQCLRAEANATQALEHSKQQRDNAFKTQQQAQQLLKQFDALNKNQQQLTTLNEQTSVIAQHKHQVHLAQLARHLAPQHTSLQKITTQLHTAKQQERNSYIQLEGCQEQTKLTLMALNTALNAFDNAKEHPINIRQLQNLLPKVAELNKARQTQQQLQQQNLQLTLTINKAKESHLHTQKNIVVHQQQQEQLRTACEQLPLLQQQLEHCTQLGKYLSDHERWQQKIQQQTQAINANHTHLFTQQSYLQKLQQATLELEFNWHSQQAAFLASQLKEGKACPVCGSHNHPAPAMHTNTQGVLIDKNALDAQRKKLSAAQESVASLKESLAAQRAELEASKAALIVLKDPLNKHPNYVNNPKKTAKEYREHYQKIQQSIKNLEYQKIQIGVLTETLNGLMADQKRAEEQLNAHQQSLHTTNTHLAVIQAQINAIELALEPQWQEPNALDTKISALTDEYQSAETTVKNCQYNNEQATLAQTRAHTELLQKQEQVTALQQEQASQNRRWLEMLNKSPFATEGDFLAAQLTPEDEQRRQQTIQTHETTLSNLQAVIKEQSLQLHGQTTPNIIEIDAHYTLANNQYQQALHDWQQQKQQLNQITTAENNLSTLHKQLQKIDDDYALYGTLAEAANGKNPKKLSLQRFVLGVLLDDVLIEASERLIKMSKGRYRLLRNQDKAKGNRASGLELLIEDNYTGKTRHANTLSGGESFLAALALALGLSDVIQAYAGGIQLEALFIDEGFGSLDSEALDLALNTLLELQNTGRMIGIISHVSELKEQMALRIDISTLPTGSQITLSTN